MVYNDIGEEIRRLFVPSEKLIHRRIPFSSLVVYNDTKGVSQLQSQAYTQPQPQRDEFTLVAYIDGACRNNGQPSAQASYGIYFGPNSPHNARGRVPASIPQTSTRAEIEALSRALDIICDITDRDFKLLHIKIATDSSFLVDAFSQWMEGWIENGGTGSNGKRVAHFDKMKQLHEKMDNMEYGDDGGRDVQFWLLPREMNREADALANQALDDA